MRLAGLSDTLTLPGLARLADRRRNTRWVSLQHGDLVPISRQHDRRRQPDHAAACPWP